MSAAPSASASSVEGASASSWLTPTRFRVLTALEAALALALGWYHLGSKSLWYDEGVSAIVARSSPAELLHIALKREPNMVGYHALLGVWRVLGDGELALRSLSVVAIAGAVVSLVAVGRRLHGRLAGLTAGLVLAVAPLAQQYAQQARSYGLTVLLVTVATFCFIVVVHGGGRGAVLAYATVAAFACYSHLFAGLVVLAQGVSLAFLPPQTVPWRRLGAAYGALALLLVPLGIFTVAGPDRIGWIERPRAADVVHVSSEIGGGGVVTVVLGLFLLVGVWRFGAVARARGRSEALWRESVGLAWAIVPFVVALVLSVTVKPLFLGRYLIVCLPGLALVVGAAMARLRIRALAVVGLAAVVAVSLVKVVHDADKGLIEDWRGAVAALARTVRSVDGVVVCPASRRAPFEYYLLRLPARDQPVPLSPAARWDTGLADRPASDRQLAGAAGPDRVWVLSGGADACPTTVEAAEEGGRVRTVRRDFVGVRLERYDR